MPSLLSVSFSIYCPSVGATVYAIVGEVGASKLRKDCISCSTFLLPDIDRHGNNHALHAQPRSLELERQINLLYGRHLQPLPGVDLLQLPEMKGKTHEEIDILFQQRVRGDAQGQVACDQCIRRVRSAGRGEGRGIACEGSVVQRQRRQHLVQGKMFKIDVSMPRKTLPPFSYNGSDNRKVDDQ